MQPLVLFLFPCFRLFPAFLTVEIHKPGVSTEIPFHPGHIRGITIWKKLLIDALTANNIDIVTVILLQLI